ncbi:MAG: hypothetical protein ABI954_13455 [Pyrinomonadaceae bacterium]
MFLVKCLMLILLIIALAPQFAAQNQPEMKSDKPIEFQGDLKIGKRYVAEIKTGEDLQSVQPVKQLKPLIHHAARIDWMNLEGLGIFSLQYRARKIEFVFEVVSEDTVFVANGRWNTTYFCRILELKTKGEYYGKYNAKTFVFVGKCKSVKPTGKRHQSYIFTFEILRTVAGGENMGDKREIAFERFADFGGRYWLNQVGQRSANSGEFQLNSEKEIEVTLLYSLDEKIKN